MTEILNENTLNIKKDLLKMSTKKNYCMYTNKFTCWKVFLYDKETQKNVLIDFIYFNKFREYLKQKNNNFPNIKILWLSTLDKNFNNLTLSNFVELITEDFILYAYKQV